MCIRCKEARMIDMLCKIQQSLHRLILVTCTVHLLIRRGKGVLLDTLYLQFVLGYLLE